MLRTVGLVTYAYDVVRSRAIEPRCREHVSSITRCGDAVRNVTTIADSVSAVGPELAHVFITLTNWSAAAGRATEDDVRAS